MIQKKVCMLGSFGVGKTSLVRRFVSGQFSDRYLSTVGVKLDRKEVEIDGNLVRLILWDIHGDDEFQRVRASYLRGMAGYFLVVDGTRSASLEVAMELHDLALKTVGEIPRLLIVNKHDLVDTWEIKDETLDSLAEEGWTVLRTSAKSGEHVEEAFAHLATSMVADRMGESASASESTDDVEIEADDDDAK